MRNKIIAVSALLLMCQLQVLSQSKKDNTETGQAPLAGGPPTSPSDLARIALAQHGGESFRNLKSLSLYGSVVLYFGSRPGDSTSGQFAMILAGSRSRTDIETPDISYREIYDGKNTYSTINAESVPPPAKFGMAVLAHFDQPGYTTTRLPDQKKLRGFQITDSEGNSTDFYVDTTTGRVMMFSFVFNHINFVTEVKSFKEVDGILVPTTLSRKYGLPKADIYMELKVKDARVNQVIGEDVFIVPKR